MWISLTLMWIDVAVACCYGMYTTQEVNSLFAFIIPAIVTIMAIMTTPIPGEKANEKEKMKDGGIERC